MKKRLSDSIESVLTLAEGLLQVDVIGGETLNFSQSFSCPDCGISIEEIEREAFLSIILLEHVRIVMVLDIRWNLILI